MTRKRRVLIAILIILVLIQFIRPEKNTGSTDSPNDITHAVNVSPEIKGILETSCYDCHSNHTEYPWYSNIQPVAGWLAHHVNEGKDELNFSEFNTYKLRRKKHKLEEMIEQVNEGEMPMNSYLIMHKNAELTPLQKTALLNWAAESIRILQDTLKK